METKSSVSINMFSVTHVGKIHAKLQYMIIILTKHMKEVTGESNLEMPVLMSRVKKEAFTLIFLLRGLKMMFTELIIKINKK